MKRQAFVREFLIDFNASKAAERAGFAPGRSAGQEGYRLLNNAEVAREIAAKVGEKLSKIDLTADRVLRGLYEEATFFGAGSTHSARVAAWTQLGRYHQLFVDRIDATVTHTFSDMTDDELTVEFYRLRKVAPGRAIEGKATREPKGEEEEGK